MPLVIQGGFAGVGIDRHSTDGIAHHHRLVRLFIVAAAARCAAMMRMVMPMMIMVVMVIVLCIHNMLRLSCPSGIRTAL